MNGSLSTQEGTGGVGGLTGACHRLQLDCQAVTTSHSSPRQPRASPVELKGPHFSAPKFIYL